MHTQRYSDGTCVVHETILLCGSTSRDSCNLAIHGQPSIMASSFSASSSPEKVSLASSYSNSLGNMHDAAALKYSPLGSQEDLSQRIAAPADSPSVPTLSLAAKELPVKGSAKRSHSSSFSLDLDGDIALNFNPREPLHKWRKLSSCEEFVGTKRSKHTIVAWNDRIYVFGGDNGRRMLNDFLVSHIHDSSWARVVYTGELGQLLSLV